MRLTRFSLAIVALAAATPLRAQLRSNRPSPATQNLPRMLVANPYASNSADSAAAVRVGDAVRKRLGEAASRSFTAITREQMNEVLLQYAYPADAVLPPTAARTLASQLQARFLVSATLARSEGGRYTVQVRAIGMNDRAGHAITAHQQPNQSLEEFGRAAADQIVPAFRALEDARKCWENQTTKPADAARFAASALKDLPGYGFAEFCLGEMAKARNAPPSEQLAHYEAAAKGDPLSLEAWSMAAVQHQALGDSAATVRVFQEMLRVAPTNQPLREQAFRLFINYGQPEAAKAVAEEGLAIDPSNADLWDLKSNACLFLEDFTCAVDALEQVFAVDSAKADSLFYNKINVAASQKPDTARFLKWAQRGAAKYPASATQLAHLANAYGVAGPLDSAMTVTQRLMAADSSDLRPALRAIQALVTARRVDDSDQLGGYIERLGDADDKQNYALILINGALPLLQQEGQDLPMAAAMSRKAVGMSPAGGRVSANANYILGLATALQLPPRDEPIMEQKSCDLARESQALVEEATVALAAGQSVRPDAVAQYQRMVESFRPRVESQVKAFCR